MTDRKDQDPFVECFFSLEVQGMPASSIAYFKALSGGEMSITLIEHNVVYPEGSSATLFIPGPTSFEPITLSQGVTGDDYFWKWWTKVSQGKRVRRSATIKAYGASKQTMTIGSTTEPTEEAQVEAEWELSNCWPLSISGFNFDLDSTDPFIAEITIVAESIERKS